MKTPPFTIRCDPDSKSWVVYCEAFDLFSAGRTKDRAYRAMVDAVRVYLKAHEQRETLEMLFTEVS